MADILQTTFDTSIKRHPLKVSLWFLLTKGRDWFRKWLGVVRHQAIS